MKLHRPNVVFFNKIPMIVGGVEARPNSHPWIVSIQKSNKHFCGGSLIRTGPLEESDLILTAAHCFYNRNGVDGITVVAGAHDLSSYPPSLQTASVLSVKMHQNYSTSTKVNDIAIVKLQTPIKFSSTVHPVCLPIQGQNVNAGTQGILAGWGVTKSGSISYSKVLLQVGVPVVEHSECASRYLTQGKTIVQNSMICTGYPEGGKDSCEGDSGGPFVINQNGAYTLHGIVSFGVGCGRAGLYGVNVRVSNYINWINANSIVG